MANADTVLKRFSLLDLWPEPDGDIANDATGNDRIHILDLYRFEGESEISLPDGTPISALVFGDVSFKINMPVSPSARIETFEAVGDGNGLGYARSLNPSDPFCGFARHGASGIVPIGSPPPRIELWARGEVEMPVIGVTGPGDYGQTVYGADARTFTLVDGGSYPPIGKVIRYISAGRAAVFFEAAVLRSV